MKSDNQFSYWDRVAETKAFTHPLDAALLQRYVPLSEPLLDYGCGYGRTLHELQVAGFANLLGLDTSAALIQRGQRHYPDLTGQLHHLPDPAALPVPDASQAAVLLLAVLTCIPFNAGQQALVAQLYAKLQPGGVLYFSDYYLQPDRLATGAYACLNGDLANAGVFTLLEGVTFRHQDPAWIAALTRCFAVRHTVTVPVFTMNGRRSEAFQLLLQKPRI